MLASSLVLTTYDWTEALALVLASALAQTERFGEVIVADDGSAEATAALVPTPRDALQGVRSCKMGFWLADAVRVNGFDERFVGWGREDSDFVARLVNAGVQRRKLKFGGIVCHLCHSERARDGMDKYLSAVR